MEMMEVALLPPQKDLNFESTCSSPYISCPSSPQRLFTNNTSNLYFSAPTSPKRAVWCFSHDDPQDAAVSSPSAVPFTWEEKPGTPKSGVQDFEFDFSGQLDQKMSSLSADELFDKGRIKPLKPPPGYDCYSATSASVASSPRSRKSTKVGDFDPFQAALEETRKTEFRNHKVNQRGRDRNSVSSSRKGTRSLSPLRVSDIVLQQLERDENVTSVASNQSKRSFFSLISFSSKKWRLRDLLLFRSASEGRPTISTISRESLIFNNCPADDSKTSSFRSVTETGSVGGSSRRRASTLSAHEMHYTTNRAISEELKRKTFLPYKRGLLGCLGLSNQISRGIDSMTRG